jgi:hypothetical protein
VFDLVILNTGNDEVVRKTHVGVLS